MDYQHARTGSPPPISAVPHSPGIASSTLQWRCRSPVLLNLEAGGIDLLFFAALLRVRRTMRWRNVVENLLRTLIQHTNRGRVRSCYRVLACRVEKNSRSQRMEPIKKLEFDSFSFVLRTS